MTRKDFEVVAKIVATLSFSIKDSGDTVGNGEAYDASVLEELQE